MKKGIFALLFALPMLASAQTFDINTKNATVDFEYLSDKTKGTLGEVSAKLIIDLENLTNAKISGSVQVAGLDTGNERRDNHLKSADFFDIEKYPRMSFTSSSVTEVNGVYKAKGTLTIKDVEKEVTFEIINSESVIKFKTTILSSDFGIMEKKGEKSRVAITVLVPIS
jgi:polyisoprenoid-binding protein YceI